MGERRTPKRKKLRTEYIVKERKEGPLSTALTMSHI